MNILEQYYLTLTKEAEKQKESAAAEAEKGDQRAIDLFDESKYAGRYAEGSRTSGIGREAAERIGNID